MMSLCLYNTYDKLHLHDIHVRSVARAAPVCVACETTLSLVDFPEDMYDKAMKSTTIGNHGEYLSRLKDANRYEELHGRLPHGILVATTCRPEKKKAISTESLLGLSPRKNIVLVMGLGRRGLPKELRERAHHHWDATGKGISLETCSAMGFIGGVLLGRKGKREIKSVKVKYG